MLLRSYVRRKRYEARLIAQEVGIVIGQMFGAVPAEPPARAGWPEAPQPAQPGLPAALAEMGAPPLEGVQPMTLEEFKRTTDANRAAFKARQQRPSPSA